MPVKKKENSDATKGFLNAAKLAAEIGDSKKIKKSSKKVSVVKKFPSKKNVTITKVVVTNENKPVQESKMITKENKSMKESKTQKNSLVEVKQSVASVDEIEGFDSLSDSPSEKHDVIKQVDSQGGRGLIEMIGGITMVLILVELIVIVSVLVIMFFVK